jgi:hypothetical protein
VYEIAVTQTAKLADMPQNDDQLDLNPEFLSQFLFE